MHYVKPIFRGVMLNVTDDCNLRCKYCFVNKSPNYMPLQIAKDTLNLLLNINKEEGRVPTISFFGGEPTLCWDSIIVPLVEYAKELKEQVEFTITTNGILLDEEKLSYMRDNNISILLSIDGIKEAQDCTRPFPNGQGSFDVLKDKLPLIIKYRPDTTFRATLYPDTCNTLFDSIMFAKDLGFKTFFTVPDDGAVWTDEHKKIIAGEVEKYRKYYIECIENNEDYIEFTPVTAMYKTITQYRQIIDNKEDYCKCKVPSCGLGIYFASVNYQGKIYACQELPSNNDLNIKYYIGDIYNGIDQDRHEKLLKEFETMDVSCVDPEQCKECFIKPVCTKLICHANSYIYNKDMSKKPVIKCYWDNLLFNEASEIVNKLGKNEKFIEIYLKRIINGN